MLKKNEEVVSTAEVMEGSAVVSKQEAKKILRTQEKIKNSDVKAFVCLKDINKIYPNGVQAVYDFNLDIKENEFIVLVGPSGCGKSTTLRMVAGLEDISSGYLYIDQILSNYLSSKDRDISMVFQSYALYPQMSVFENIAFPLKSRKYAKAKKVKNACILQDLVKIYSNMEELEEAFEESKRVADRVAYIATKLVVEDSAVKTLGINKKTSYEEVVSKKDTLIAEIESKKAAEMAGYKDQGYEIDDNFIVLKDGKPIIEDVKLTRAEIREKVFEAARILDLGPYLDRRPKELSGGQMQRVALGRAIVRNAKLFLMDEPLSNLDAKLRVQMRSEIVRIHEQIGATTIYVTHDQTEAMTMATRIAVMSKGWIQQIGTPQEIYSHPNNIFVATFIGSPAMNIFEGTYNKGVLEFKDGYKIALDKEFVVYHDKFYTEKIAVLEEMIKKDGFKKLHAIKLIDDLDEEENTEAICKECVEVLKSINFSDEEKMSLDTVLGVTDVKELRNKLIGFRRTIMHFGDITSSDLSILKNARSFSHSNNKKNKEDTMYYNKRKHEFFWTRLKNKRKNHFKIHDSIVFSNNLYCVAMDMINSFKEALNGTHNVKVGIRPEHIHLSSEYNNSRKTNSFTIESEVVELLGSELLVHTTWNDKEMIAKISTGTVVKPHSNVELCFNQDKVIVFDDFTGDSLQIIK